MNKKIASSLILLLIASITLSAACTAATPAPTQAPAQPPTQSPPTPVPATQPPATQPVEPTQAPPAPTEAVAAGGEIPENVANYALQGDLASMDPPYMLATDTNIGFNVYETLTLWYPDKGIVPVLATDWASNADGTEWTFHLRKDVTFHDGTPMTAKDVKASLDRNIKVGLVAYDFIGVDSIEVVDDYTVKFICSAPRNMPLILTASFGMFIYSSKGAELGEDWFAKGNDAGSGPYMIQSFDPGKNIVLTYYKNYWRGWQKGQFTKVILTIVEDPTVRDQMIRSGEADFTVGLPLDSLDSLKTVQGLVIQPFQPMEHLVAGFALNLAPVNNLKIRQALAYSFPYQAVQQSVFRGYGVIPKGFGPTSLWNPPADFPSYEYNLDKARALLKEAGSEKGFELKMALNTGSKETKEAAELWQAELAKLNIKLDVQEVSSSAFWEYAYNPNNDTYQLFMITAGGDVPSPWSWLIDFTSSPLGWMPFIGYKNDRFDKLVFDAWAMEATDAPAAHDLWVQAQRILYDDAASVFILDPQLIPVYRDNIEGYKPNPPYTDIVFWYDLKRK